MQNSEASPLHAGGNRYPQGMQDGRHQVYERNLILNDSRPDTRNLDHQRHMEGRVIDKEAVGFFAVFSQSFPVIACQDNDRVVEQSHFFQRRHETADLSVIKGDFAIVGAFQERL